MESVDVVITLAWPATFDRSMGDPRHPDIFMTSTVGSNIGAEDLKLLMEVIAVKGWKIVVLHCEPRLMVRIVAKSVAMNLFGTGYGWFLSEKATTTDPKVLRGLPEGLLGLQGFYSTGTSGVLAAASRTISCAYECMQECYDNLNAPPTVPPVPSLAASSTSGSYPSSSSSSSSASYSDESTSVTLSNLFSFLSSPQMSRLSAPLSESPLSSTLSAESWPSYADFPPLADTFRVSCNNTTHYFTQ